MLGEYEDSPQTTKQGPVHVFDEGFDLAGLYLSFAVAAAAAVVAIVVV